MGDPVEDAARAHARVSMAALESLYSTRVAKERGLEAIALGGTLVLATSAPDVDLNRVIGLGLFEPAAGLVDRIERLYGRRGVPFSVQLHPGSEPDLPRALEAAGLRPDQPWTVLSRGVEAPAPPGAAIRVDAVRSTDDGARFASLIVRAFGLPFSQQELFAAPVGRPGWTHYVAYVGDQPAGAAWMHQADGAVLLGGSGTLAAWRRRGVQRALTWRRLADAAAAGATTAFIETQASWDLDAPHELRAAQALGFVRAFELASYVYTRGSRQRFDDRTGRWR
ncbi:MAG TPA: GNAT family N-acetyltransferase [Candidatus Limnocylindria bacterium]|nr:GNAT family N-acetyltransferase [Candidatus Limnocylindria bacterium]